MFTDGLTELHMAEGELLGEEALGRHISTLIRAHHGAAAGGAEREPSANVIATKLTALLDSLQEGMAKDDRTFLIARRV